MNKQQVKLSNCVLGDIQVSNESECEKSKSIDKRCLPTINNKKR